MAALIAFILSSILVLANAGLMPKIIDGTVAKPGEIPYQVALVDLKSGRHFCGGSILNEDYVITAAHCVKGKSLTSFKIIAGTVDLSKAASQLSEHSVKEIYINEKYNSTDSWINDIALMKEQEFLTLNVKTRFVKSALISFVPMPAPGELVKTNDSAIVSGFGKLAYDGDRTDLLHWVKIRIASQDYCKNVYKGKQHIYGTHLCAYDPTAVRGHCKGDSGGPLMVNGKLAGLVSWSKRCANTVCPSVYTRVSSYIDWIKKHAL